MNDPTEVTAGEPTWMARHVQAGWHMPGTGTITGRHTHLNGTVTFSGPQGHRTFSLDTLVQAAPRSGTIADSAALDQIAALVGSREWNADLLEPVCGILLAAGRAVADVGDPQDSAP